MCLRGVLKNMDLNDRVGSYSMLQKFYKTINKEF